MNLRRAISLILLVGAVGVATYGSYRHDLDVLVGAVACAVVAFVVNWAPVQIEAIVPAVVMSEGIREEAPVRDELPHLEADPITDSLTGLLNDVFFAGLIGTKVATARRRLWPVSIVLLQAVMDDVLGADQKAREQALYEFANVIRVTIRSADVACRVGTRTFALILDDTDEDGGAWVAERIQVAQARRGATAIAKICAGIASYPSHGIEATDLLMTAKRALSKAASQPDGPGLGLVIVAPQRPI